MSEELIHTVSHLSDHEREHIAQQVTHPQVAARNIYALMRRE